MEAENFMRDDKRWRMLKFLSPGTTDYFFLLSNVFKMFSLIF